MNYVRKLTMLHRGKNAWRRTKYFVISQKILSKHVILNIITTKKVENLAILQGLHHQVSTPFIRNWSPLSLICHWKWLNHFVWNILFYSKWFHHIPCSREKSFNFKQSIDTLKKGMTNEAQRPITKTNHSAVMAQPRCTCAVVVPALQPHECRATGSAA